MLNRTLFRFGCVFFVCLIGFTAENNVRAQQPHGKNWGVRVGLNAVSITSYKAYLANELLTNSSYTNRNGYLLAGFARFNLSRMFLQPEVAWNEYRRACSFSLPNEDTNSYYSPIDLDVDSKAINTGLLVGYNIVHNYPFLFGFYIGSSFIGTYQTDFSMGNEKWFHNNDWSLNYSGIMGFSINISRIYFDLRYEMSLPDADLGLKDIPGFPNNYNNVRIKKTEAFLSFSFGVMF